MAATQGQVNSGTGSEKTWSVKGKSAVVTGAGSGINFSFASLLLSQGCNVLIADLSLRPESEALLSQYPNTPTNTTTARALFHKTDVTSWPQLTSMFTTAISAFGKIDILCPGAGIYDPNWSNFWHPPGAPGSSSRDSPNGGRYTSLDINVTHPIRATQMAISHFLNPPAGVEKASPTNPKRVVIISSIAGQLANFHCPIYTAAKHAMNGFIRSLAPLERLGIRVNGVAPGVIRTPLWTEHPEKMTFFNDEKDEWATAEEVAVAMVRCLEEGALGGGVILEVGKEQTRLVEMLNDPGPSGRGHTVSNIVNEWSEVFGVLGGEKWGAWDGEGGQEKL